jgi:uncharacterized membrane protein
MENNNENTGGTNWTAPSTGQGTGGQELPGAKNSFILGLIGLILSPICCCGISGAGIVLSILGLVKSGKAIAAYDANPGTYDEALYKKAKTAKTLSIIGLIVGIICFGFFIFSLIFRTSAGMMDYQRMMDRMK